MDSPADLQGLMTVGLSVVRRGDGETASRRALSSRSLLYCDYFFSLLADLDDDDYSKRAAQCFFKNV